MRATRFKPRTTRKPEPRANYSDAVVRYTADHPETFEDMTPIQVWGHFRYTLQFPVTIEEVTIALRNAR
jgi:hypothetical protein